MLCSRVGIGYADAVYLTQAGHLECALYALDTSVLRRFKSKVT